jgi:hypothetical protein
MGRIIILVLALGLLTAAEEPAAGWRFPLNKAVWYRYELKQDVAWHSGGDDLAYASALTWTFALRATASDGPTATVNATILSVVASLDGPAAQVRVDSRDTDAASDPVYGHLMGLAGTTLVLTVHQPSGRVSAVAGGDELVKRINARHPPAVPGDPPPLDAAARRLYSSEALAAWWSDLLAQPATEPQTVPLAPPLSGALTRTWSGDRFTLALPAGVAELPVQLVDGPNPVAGTVKAVAGSGRLAMADGVVATVDGELAYTLSLTALTQAVEQQHRQRWTLKRFLPEPAADGKK